MAEQHDCKDCIRYTPNPDFNTKNILSVEGWCRIPEATDGLLGHADKDDNLNVLFARARLRCDEGRRWFKAKAADVSGVQEVDSAFRHAPNCGARFATAGACTCGVDGKSK